MSAADTWLDILGRFSHLEVADKDDRFSDKKIRTQTMLFPRYHQWDAVTRLVDDARTTGPGHRYLIQHSAGSGKTNSISWLAHRLSVLHDARNTPVFDAVVVITDRNVLDAQLQEAIRQIDRTFLAYCCARTASVGDRPAAPYLNNVAAPTLREAMRRSWPIKCCD